MDKHKMFLTICDLFAQQSKCVSHQVAALAVKNGRILGTGINGSLPGELNCNEVFSNYNPVIDREEHHRWSLIHECHAEINLILMCLKNGVSLEDSIIYITTQPCSDCTKALLGAGIQSIVYKNKYDKANEQSLILAEKRGIKVIQYADR